MRYPARATSPVSCSLGRERSDSAETFSAKGTTKQRNEPELRSTCLGTSTGSNGGEVRALVGPKPEVSNEGAFEEFQ